MGGAALSRRIPYVAGIQPTADDFRALARSSPWRWSTLRFTLTRTPVAVRHDDGVRGWLRRPDLVRVETLEGDLICVIQESPDQGSLLSTGGGSPAWSPPFDGGHALDDHGLRRIPRGYGSVGAYDAPMFRSYSWVALFDPVELADGHEGPGTDVGDVSVVDHHGRESLQAVVQPTVEYAPRCECCSLLYAALIDARLADDGLPIKHPDGFRHPDATMVRLDVGTGVCVFTEEVGGSRAGRGLDLCIEGVDEEMPDGLFPIHPSRRGGGRDRRGIGPRIEARGATASMARPTSPADLAVRPLSLGQSDGENYHCHCDGSADERPPRTVTARHRVHELQDDLVEPHPAV